MTPISFANLDISFHLSGFLMLALFGIVCSIWAIFTLIVRYHWKNYGTGGLELITMNFAYLAGSAVLILGMIIFGSLYMLSLPAI